jgi:hypothetical protein
MRSAVFQNYRVETASDRTETCSKKWPGRGLLQWLHPLRLCGLPIGCWVRTEVEYGELFNEDVRESAVQFMSARW